MLFTDVNKKKTVIVVFTKKSLQTLLHRPRHSTQQSLSIRYASYFTMFHNCRTIPRHFSLRQVKFCIGQRKYKQKFTTQGVTKRVNSRSLTKLPFRILQNSRKNTRDHPDLCAPLFFLSKSFFGCFISETRP